MFKRWLTWGLVAVSLLASGCAYVQVAPEAQDAAAKTFATQPGKGSLYIYRNEGMGSAAPLKVVVNGVNLGDTSGKSYMQLDLTPGRYNVESRGETVATLAVDVPAGRPVFVWQEVKFGIMQARTALHLVDSTQGRAGVNESKLLVVPVKGSDIPPVGGAPASTPPADASKDRQLRDLDKLRKDRKISEADYQRRRAALLK